MIFYFVTKSLNSNTALIKIREGSLNTSSRIDLFEIVACGVELKTPLSLGNKT